MIKKGIKVLVISGKYKGKTGSVLSIKRSNKVIVSGINLVKRHCKANPKLQIKASIITKEAPIHISNLKVVQ